MNVTRTKRLNKCKVLRAFVDKHRDLAVQGSPEWLEQRQTIIGGSEMSIITGDNGFSSIANLVAQKVGLAKFDGNLATRWGNLFEPVTKRICNIIFNPEAKIFETGSVQNVLHEHQRFSPDGLTVMRIGNQYYIVLLEFKAPFSTIPSAKVPPHYLPQLKTGMCALEPVETSVFVNNMFRKCGLDQLKRGMSYDTNFHKSKGMDLLEAPISYGVMLFYLPHNNLKQFQDFYLDHLETNYVCDDSGDDSGGDSGTDPDDDPDFNANRDSESDVEYSESDSGFDVPDIEHDDLIVRASKQIEYLEPHAQFYDLIDLGTADMENFDNFIRLAIDHRILEVEYLEPSIIKSSIEQCNVETYDDKTNGMLVSRALEHIKKSNEHIKKYKYDKLIQKFTQTCKKNNDIPLAVLPWKLMKSANIVVAKEPDFMTKHAKRIDEVISIVRDIRDAAPSDSSGDPQSVTEHIKNKFNCHFPNNDFIKEYDLFTSAFSAEELKNM